MKINMTLPIIAPVFFICMAILHIVSPSSQNEVVSLCYVAVSFVPAFAGIYALRFTGTGNAFGKSILLGTIGLWMWAIAECISYTAKLMPHVSSYSTINNLFFFPAYFIFFVAMIVAYKSFGTPVSKLPQKLLISVSLFVSLFVAPMLYFLLHKAYTSEMDALRMNISIMYGIIDIALIVTSIFVVSLLREFPLSRFGNFWRIITLGFVFFLAADVLFSFFNVQHHSDLKSYTYIDLFWTGGYLLFAYALLDIATYLKKVHASMRDEVSGIVG